MAKSTVGITPPVESVEPVELPPSPTPSKHYNVLELVGYVVIGVSLGIAVDILARVL
jgi:hypothetical protein